MENIFYRIILGIFAIAHRRRLLEYQAGQRTQDDQHTIARKQKMK